MSASTHYSYTPLIPHTFIGKRKRDDTEDHAAFLHKIPRASTSALSAWDEVKRGQLHNGFSYVLRRNTKPPGVFECHLQVRVGSLHEDDGEEGLAHYLEHCVFLGLCKIARAWLLIAVC